nr:MAG TPA_asm: hypothetical protein [Caudoviricetes sp.]
MVFAGDALRVWRHLCFQDRVQVVIESAMP